MSRNMETVNTHRCSSTRDGMDERRAAHFAVGQRGWLRRTLPICVLAAFSCDPNTGTGAYAVERSFLVAGDQRLGLHLPAGRKAPIPSVLVFHSAMGRTESVLEWSDRLAKAGFAAVVLDFYDGRTATSPEEARRLRDSANERSTVFTEMIQRAWTAMQNDDQLRSTERFLLGWSYGGAWATFASGFLPGVAGVVAFYGQAFTDDAKLYDALEAPVLFVGGENDNRPTPGTLREVVKQLESNGKRADLALVPAGHAFAERNHPGYDADAAEKAWESVIKFLEDNAGSHGW